MEPIHWVKAKYTQEKTKGKYRSSHNDGRRYKRKKDGDTQPRYTVLVVGPTGKRRFVKDFSR